VFRDDALGSALYVEAQATRLVDSIKDDMDLVRERIAQRFEKHVA
jgi:hypothetical protein